MSITIIMNIVKSVFALLALINASAFAQLSSLPPPSAIDGTPVKGIGVNSGPTHWEDPATLGAFRLASDATVPLPSRLTWANTAPVGITNALQTIHTQAGTIRAIFTGETAGWLNDFGYSRAGGPTSSTDSFTVFSNIQAVAPATVAFGDHVDVLMLPGEALTFDFWLNATGSFTPANPSPTTNGGVYTVFNQTNSSPYIAPGNVRFAQSPLMVNTLVNGQYVDVATYMVAIEDWRLDRQSDTDYSDLIFGIQFFPFFSPPGGSTPVPEPSTYGLMGVFALFTLTYWRRMRGHRSRS